MVIIFSGWLFACAVVAGSYWVDGKPPQRHLTIPDLWVGGLSMFHALWFAASVSIYTVTLIYHFVEGLIP